MKNLFFLFLFLGSLQFGFAGNEIINDVNSGASDAKVMQIPEEETYTCEYKANLTVSIYGQSVSVECTGSATSETSASDACAKAWATVKECVKKAVDF